MYSDSEDLYDDSDFEDEEFDNMRLIIAFPRKQRILRPRIDHFTTWIDDIF